MVPGFNCGDIHKGRAIDRVRGAARGYGGHAASLQGCMNALVAVGGNLIPPGLQDETVADLGTTRDPRADAQPVNIEELEAEAGGDA